MPTAVAWAVNYERFGALERLRGSAQGISERPIGRLERVRNARYRSFAATGVGELDRPMRTQRSTLWGMSKTVPVREFRTHLADLLDEVTDRREHVTVTRHGRPAAVLIPVDEYEALEETAEILSDEDTLAAIRRGLDDLAAGDVASLDEVRAEHAARPRS